MHPSSQAAGAGVLLEYAKVVFKIARTADFPPADAAIPNLGTMSTDALHLPTDPLLRSLKCAYLKRMARFALIDGIPSPWAAEGRSSVADGDRQRTQGD